MFCFGYLFSIKAQGSQQGENEKTVLLDCFPNLVKYVDYMKQFLLYCGLQLKQIYKQFLQLNILTRQLT